MKLLTSQKNRLFDIIVENELNPSMFDYTEIIDNKIPKTQLKVKKIDFFFQFSAGIGELIRCDFCPSNDGFFKDWSRFENWGAVLDKFSNWVKIIKRETDVPDKWKQLISETSKFKLSAEDNPNFFTVGEYEELKVKMKTLKENLAILGLLPEQMKQINAKLEHLEKVAVSLSKTDWTEMFIGSMMGLMMQLALPPEINQTIWQFIRQTFSTLFLN